MEIILPQLGLFVWTTTLFLVFFFLLARFAWKPIMNALKEREETIESSLQEAQRARDEMARLKSDNENLLAQARQERDKMLIEAKQMREQIVSKARDEAAAAAAKEMEKAKAQIDSEKAAALNEIKNQTGLLAIQITEKLLRRELDDKPAQEKFANQLVRELSKS
jgi:F-type H+-transporting ATPase subunit b